MLLGPEGEWMAVLEAAAEGALVPRLAFTPSHPLELPLMLHTMADVAVYGDRLLPHR